MQGQGLDCRCGGGNLECSCEDTRGHRKSPRLVNIKRQPKIYNDTEAPTSGALWPLSVFRYHYLVGIGKDNEFSDMLKLQIFAKFLAAVADETGVEASVIVSGDRSAEAVDARYLLVYFLARKGFYASTTAPLIRRTKRSVNHMLSDFEGRMNRSPMMQLSFSRLHTLLGGAIDV